MRSLSGLEHLFDRLALAELHDRLLPVRTATDRASHALLLAALVRGPDTGDVYAEQLLDRGADLRLGRVGVHLEGVFPARHVRCRGLLGDQRPHDGAMECRHRLLPPSLLPAATLGDRTPGGL